jgi:hypothetical protein
VLPGRAVLLTDGESDAPPPDGTPHMMISVAAGGPAQTGDRGAFAQDVFAAVRGVRDVHIQSSEPLRILGQPGYQIMANGKFGPSGVNVTIVQWIRFGSGAYLHLLGVAAAPQWTAAYARFRQVRDGVDVR